MREPNENAPGVPEDIPGQISCEGSEGMDNPRAPEEPAEGPGTRREAYFSPVGTSKAGDCLTAEDRVRRMEELFDRLSEAVADGCTAAGAEDCLRETARILSEYLNGGEWLQDYERDEQGLFPSDLKRGVLSQDGLYDLLDDPAVRALLVE